jgi:hypothetical protein
LKKKAIAMVVFQQISSFLRKIFEKILNFFGFLL